MYKVLLRNKDQLNSAHNQGVCPLVEGWLIYTHKQVEGHKTCNNRMKIGLGEGDAWTGT